MRWDGWPEQAAGGGDNATNRMQPPKIIHGLVLELIVVCVCAKAIDAIELSRMSYTAIANVG
jgi:hypothetical protein